MKLKIGERVAAYYLIYGMPGAIIAARKIVVVIAILGDMITVKDEHGGSFENHVHIKSLRKLKPKEHS